MVDKNLIKKMKQNGLKLEEIEKLVEIYNNGSSFSSG
jgi:DNA-binding transcriptional MerR regulator